MAALLSQFTPDYAQINAVEEGGRILSFFPAPNPFAGCMGIGVLLDLGLAATEEKLRVRAVYLSCLLVSALAFVLGFSMGACLAILPAFLIFLALAGKGGGSGCCCSWRKRWRSRFWRRFPFP